MRKKIYFVLAALLSTVLTASAEIKLPHIFASNMVLQQLSECPIWGYANPGENVYVTASWGVGGSTFADNTGKWKVMLKTPIHGGPYSIDIHGTNHIKLENVLIGEVWLATGRANVEIPVGGWGRGDTITGSAQAIENCDNDNIRIMTILSNQSFLEEADASGWWASMNKNNTPHVSAFAYFFAKKIYEETGIPVGIVVAGVGGSCIESWVAKDYLKKIPSFKQRMSDFDGYLPMQTKLNNWIKEHSKIVPSDDWQTRFKTMKFSDYDCAKLSYDDAKWNTMRLPCYYDDSKNMGVYDGIVWFRKWVDIPGDWVGKKLKISLGPIDDMDECYVNGELVGATLVDGKWNVKRVYDIAPGVVNSGEMLISVRLIDDGSGGGIYGNASDMKIYPEGQEDDAIYIAGDWKYLPTGEFLDGMIYEYDCNTREYYNRPKVSVMLSKTTVTALYNAMVAPLMPYKMAGVICYNGEGNVGRASEYASIMQQQAACLRAGFQCPDMRFYYTQIAPFEYGEYICSAELRDAQRRALELIPNSGMTSLMDLGRKDSKLIHRMSDAAERVARWALNDLYGRPCETSGPLLSSFEINKGRVVLSFTHTEGGLVVKGAKLRDFEISDSKGKYYPAEAEIVGDKIEVWSPRIPKPQNVRYCWKNYYRDVSLYNGAGLPASSFTTEKKLSD